MESLESCNRPERADHTEDLRLPKGETITALGSTAMEGVEVTDAEVALIEEAADQAAAKYKDLETQELARRLAIFRKQRRLSIARGVYSQENRSRL